MKERGKIIALLAIIFLAYLFFQIQKMDEVGFNWLQPQESKEIFLAEYPKEIFRNGTFVVSSNFAAECDYCLGKIAVGEGVNRIYFDPEVCPGNVTLACEGKHLSFSYAVRYSEKIEEVAMRVEADVANRTLVLKISGEGNSDTYRPLIVLVDGGIASAPLHRLNGEFSHIERIPLGGGAQLVEVFYNGKMIHAEEVFVPPAFSLSALLTVLLALAAAYFVPGKPFVKFASAILIIAGSLVTGFELSKFGLGLLVPLALVGTCIWLRRQGKGKPIGKKEAAADSRILSHAMIAGLLFVLYIGLVNIFISDYDVWGAYYFRHAQATFEAGTTDYFDSLSYLGRPSTYPPVFLEFSAQLARAFGSGFEAIRVPLNLLSAFAFASTSFLLFRHYGGRERWLAAFLFLTQWALLLTASGIGLHIFAFTLLNASLLLMATNPAASTLSLGLAFACHPITLVFFPFYHYATNRFRLDLKRVLIWGVLAVVISLPFYLPIFMRAGLPYEIMPGQWGYLLSYGIDGMRFDFQFLLPLFVGCAIAGIFSKKYRVPSILLAGLLLFNTYISLRSDLVVAMVGAALFPLVFEKWLKDRRVYAVVAALFILPNFLIGAVVLSGTQYHCSWGLADDICSAPMQYVSLHTPSESKIAVDPLYGHLAAWMGKRPVLADLYVEYADQEKWVAENDCAWNLNCSAAEAYGVDIFILHDFYKTPRSVPFDRIYDNGFMHIFRKG